MKEHRVLIEVLGYQVCCISNSEAVIQKVLQLHPHSQPHSDKSCLKLRIMICDAISKMDAPHRYSVDDRTLEGSFYGSNFISADRSKLEGAAFITKDLLENAYLFRFKVVNALCFYLLGLNELLPLHCSGFKMGSQVFLFLGGSGYGKSTLALEALKRGHGIFSEDVCFARKATSLTFVSDCREIHVNASTPKHSFANLIPSPSHNGKKKQIIEIPPALRLSKIENPIIVFMKPQHNNDNTTLSSRVREESWNQLGQPRESGFNLLSRKRRDLLHEIKLCRAFTAFIGNNFDFLFDQITNLVDRYEYA